eukprot:5167527-Amphidinium_carterae.6
MAIVAIVIRSQCQMYKHSVQDSLAGTLSLNWWLYDIKASCGFGSERQRKPCKPVQAIETSSNCGVMPLHYIALQFAARRFVVGWSLAMGAGASSRRMSGPAYVEVDGLTLD